LRAEEGGLADRERAERWWPGRTLGGKRFLASLGSRAVGWPLRIARAALREAADLFV